jgi:hypothetical protein
MSATCYGLQHATAKHSESTRFGCSQTLPPLIDEGANQNMVPGCIDDTSHRHPECPGDWHDTVVRPRRQLHEDRQENSPFECNMLRLATCYGRTFREHQI